MRVPSGEKATDWTYEVWPLSTFGSTPVAMIICDKEEFGSADRNPVV